MTAIRLARSSDAADICAIYAPVVRETAISFELEPPTVDAMMARLAAVEAAGLPWLVHEEDGAVTGYAYAARHRGDRPAYHWSVEVSVYIAARARGRGVGNALYSMLFNVLGFQNIQNAYAGATLPNEASVRLHEGLGFERVGIYRKVGYKFGAWHDTIWWVKHIGNHDVPAPAIISLQDAWLMDGFPLSMNEERA
jgi:L-amino acid N-acyltransferase YncA